jgi:hypothetical protein
MSNPPCDTFTKKKLMMKRKEEFLRAIQQGDPRRTHDLRLAVGWALNMDGRTIPPDVKAAARRFLARMTK